MTENIEKKSRKSDYNRKYREKKKLEIQQEAPVVEPAQIEPPQTPRTTTKQKRKVTATAEEDQITLEEYVETLVNAKLQKKKTSLVEPQTQPASSYSSYMLLVPLLLPLLKASSEIAMKYLNAYPSKQKEITEQPLQEHQFSLTQLMPQ